MLSGNSVNLIEEIKKEPLVLISTQILVLDKIKKLKNNVTDKNCKMLIRASERFLKEYFLGFTDLDNLIKKYKRSKLTTCKELSIILDKIYSISDIDEEFLTFFYLTIWSIVNTKQIGSGITVYNKFMKFLETDKIIKFYKTVYNLIKKDIKNNKFYILTTSNSFSGLTKILEKLKKDLNLEIIVKPLEEFDDKLITIRVDSYTTKH